MRGCDCVALVNRFTHEVDGIAYCQMHGAAPAMLKSLIQIERQIMGGHPVGHDAVVQARAAIKKAGGVPSAAVTDASGKPSAVSRQTKNKP